MGGANGGGSVEAARCEFADRVCQQVARTVVGQETVVERVLIALLTGGHLLLEGVPGIAKTLMVQAVAKAIHLQFARVQFTIDLLPGDSWAPKCSTRRAASSGSTRAPSSPTSWDGMDHPRPEEPPRVLIECGGNMLRRTRGGKTALLNSLWPKLDLIVSIDFRISQTGLYSDYVLPAAQHYEKIGFHIPTPHLMNLTFSEKAAEPAGEARNEWQIYNAIFEKMAERAQARGLTAYKGTKGQSRRYAALPGAYTMKGFLLDEERLADEQIRDSALAGTLPMGTNLRTLREKGHVRFIDWGLSPMALAPAHRHRREAGGRRSVWHPAGAKRD